MDMDLFNLYMTVKRILLYFINQSTKLFRGLILLLVLILLNFITVESYAKSDCFSKYTPIKSSKVIDQHFKNASDAYKDGNVDIAIKEIQDAIKISPNDAHLHFILGDLYKEIKDDTKSLQEYQKAIGLKQRFKEAYSALIQIYTEKNDINTVIQTLNSLLKVNKNDPDLLYNLATFYGIQKDYNNAIKTFNMLLLIDKDNNKAIQGIALAYKKQLDNDNAIFYYKKALSLNASPSIYNSIGLCYTQKKDFSEALRNFQSALKISPQNEEYLYNQALAYLELRDYINVLDSINKILSINSNNSKALLLKDLIEGKITRIQRTQEVAQDSADQKAAPENYDDVFQQTEEVTDISYNQQSINLSAILLAGTPIIIDNNESINVDKSSPEGNIYIKPDVNLIVSNNPTIEMPGTPETKMVSQSIVTESIKDNIEEKNTSTQKQQEVAQVSNDKTVAPENYDDVLQQTEEVTGISDNQEPINLLAILLAETPITIDNNKPINVTNYPANERICIKFNVKPIVSESSEIIKPDIPENKTVPEPTTTETANEKIASPFKLASAQDNIDLPADETLKTAESLQNKIALLEKLSILKPDNPKILYNLAVSYYKNDELEKAEEQLLKVISIDNNFNDALSLLGIVYTKLNKFNEAKAVYSKLSGPESAEIFRQKGYIHYSLNEFDEAIKMYQKALTISPNDLMSRFLLALIYDRMGYYNEEIQQFNKILEVEPNNTRAIKGLAIAYMSAGNNVEATNKLVALLSIDPTDKNTYLYLEKLYLTQLNISEATNILNKFIERFPDDDEGYYLLGNIYARSGNVREAIINYQKALSINPDNAIYHYTLGVAYIENGDKNSAQREITILNSLNPELATDLQKLY